jgi:hypothetical protein
MTDSFLNSPSGATLLFAEMMVVMLYVSEKLF